jgi:hypothetical protein
MEVIYQDLPDDRWRHAAEVAFATWKPKWSPPMPARFVLSSWRSPDGALVPYLIRGEAISADGSSEFRLTAAVLGDELINAHGAAAATEFLAAVGFPVHPIALGHLLDVLYLTSATEAGWFDPPCTAGWDHATERDASTQMAPALDYAGGGAVLHLYKVASRRNPYAPPASSPGGPGSGEPGSGGPASSGGPPPGSMPPLTPDGRPLGSSGGGFAMPEVERLDVTFDARAAFTTTRFRRSPDRTSWEVVP